MRGPYLGARRGQVGTMGSPRAQTEAEHTKQSELPHSTSIVDGAGVRAAGTPTPVPPDQPPPMTCPGPATAESWIRVTAGLCHFGPQPDQRACPYSAPPHPPWDLQTPAPERGRALQLCWLKRPRPASCLYHSADVRGPGATLARSHTRVPGHSRPYPFPIHRAHGFSSRHQLRTHYPQGCLLHASLDSSTTQGQWAGPGALCRVLPASRGVGLP